ncbi:btb/poz-like protein [Lasiosphaeris hirsuta]|uniref:Btb/poz-like protein n=1 Tax=Lasiosphaeris hirsuta TaxID=260670 RepID=A0AA40AZX7_9PEZI|nr:btb/poz-like protein [Lasiosphaeris hirsuta]
MDISPDGDVILVVGPQSARLRVHSRCLSSASKVFGAMFGPIWSEGRGLSQESPKEVRLEEDDATALRTICCVIHHRNDAVPKDISPPQVLQIAIAADKYDLGVALIYATIQWLQHKDNLSKTEMACLMTAAYIFGDMDMFVKGTLALIINYQGPYLELLGNEAIHEHLPHKTICESRHL